MSKIAMVNYATVDKKGVVTSVFKANKKRNDNWIHCPKGTEIGYKYKNGKFKKEWVVTKILKKLVGKK